MELANKTILITGASTGVGEKIALRLAKENCSLALIARNVERLEKVVEKAKILGAKEVRSYCCDIANTPLLSETIDKIVTDFGGIDVLINNAGVWQKLMQLDEMSAEMIDDVLNVNLSALIHTTRLTLPYLRQREKSAIINIVSKSGVLAQAGQSVYTASKYGARGFTEVLKADLKGTNVKVTGLYQSGTNTAFFAKANEPFDTNNFTEPEDLADVVAYILKQPEKIWLHDVRIDR
ncbi:Uncharacterized oxidoreductase SAV2478 [Phocoenobacter uteri]|uniref:Uncharacterized oxidoreductase SAV2478 n=1 Tax=Phocoenobacter uteri TaxID=146806 RepID=A0A379C9R9_9PAST|nr:SDR family oxidoreductase [Phocoenobacter uteri]MDG6882279.1 oxidoreductase [Phocoenobacter uteri]SUB58436.1 Uncharacterized oxidoreductase SAV2478 [Phocoenobacter uteri]